MATNYTQLDNYMTDANGHTYSTDFHTNMKRRITFESNESLGTTVEGGTVVVQITVAHRQGGTYHTSIYRQTLRDGIVEFRLMEDRYAGGLRVKGTRYSAKNLEAVALDVLNAFIADEKSAAEITDFAKELCAPASDAAYVAGFNLPGCLPDNVEEFDDTEEAWEYLVGEAEECAEEVEMMQVEGIEPSATERGILDGLERIREAKGEMSVQIGGLVYFVQRAESSQ